jgi:5-methylcytosine-specific restriction endonuclease McrA
MIIVLVVLGMFIIPWLFERFSKPPVNEQRTRVTEQNVPKAKRGVRKSRRWESYNEFPDFNPHHDDELEWRNEVEIKLRKHSGYPPDWERRRTLVFLRDGGRCQSKEHRGGSCGRLLCEPNQIWNFKYGVKLLVDAHVDHIRSILAGGDHSLTNLQLLCARCHALKHPGHSKLDAMTIPRPVPRGRGRGKYLRENFFTRKAPKPPDEDIPF